jgi:Zn-dependent protease
VAGPVSNFIVATGTLIVLGLVSLMSPMGHSLVGKFDLYRLGFLVVPDSPLVPLVFFLYAMMTINVVLGVFNLIPVPPLDGSHVLRHFLSDSVRRAYDTIGIFGLIALVYLGGGLLSALISPPIQFFAWILTRF